jgi:acyl-coenzyme A thioesterase PaaI-like protein
VNLALGCPAGRIVRAGGAHVTAARGRRGQGAARLADLRFAGPTAGGASRWNVRVPEDQRDVTAAVLAAVSGFLGGPRAAGDEWCFDFGQHLESNWGAVYGGAIAASTLAVARSVVPDRSPRSLHLQIVRSVPRGRAFARTRLRHEGRTIATVEVDLFDERRKLAAAALLTMVTPGALAAQHHITPHPVANDGFGADAPICESLNLTPRRDGEVVRLNVENRPPSLDGTLPVVCPCTVPWEDLEVTGPESACLAADACVGAPMVNSTLPHDQLGPNPDLTLRFTTAPAAPVIAAAGTILSIQHGSTTIGIEVQAGHHQLAHGLATSLLLPPA